METEITMKIHMKIMLLPTRPSMHKPVLLLHILLLHVLLLSYQRRRHRRRLDEEGRVQGEEEVSLKPCMAYEGKRL